MARLTPRPGIMDIAPYVGGQSKDTSFKGKLSSNESALGTSPAALKAYAEAAANVLTNPVLDPYGKIPEFKFSACRVTPAAAMAAE